jgi:hypothetical protein
MSESVAKSFNKFSYDESISIASWMFLNTSLSPKQIAQFCNLHVMAVQAMFDGKAHTGVIPLDPVGIYVSRQQISDCENDENLQISHLNHYLSEFMTNKEIAKSLGREITKISRNSRASAAKYCIENTNFNDSQVAKICKVTKETSKLIRDGSYKNIKSLASIHPVVSGLCNQDNYDREIAKSS